MNFAQLERIARKLEQRNLRLEAQAIRAVNSAYRNMSLADLLALVRQVTENPVSAARVAELDRLMSAFYSAAQVLESPPSTLAVLLNDVVKASIFAVEAMLQSAGGVLEAFRLRPDAEIAYTRYAAERLERYWGVETTRFRNEVQSVLLEGLERGSGINQIAAHLRERVTVSRSRARLIVANELGNASGNTQRESQLEAGITHYIWRSAGDLRVRPDHRARNGETFAWDEPPPDGHPGFPIRCRCVAIGVLPEAG